ncbi:lipase/acyltransferase domain-containing protein [Bacillus sp. PM5]|uniref:lipase/acyltransferase domain-containing protein n=1 Tax=Bacillus sp. PM5 TaxID=3414495 RepID=UPI003DA9F82E
MKNMYLDRGRGSIAVRRQVIFIPGIMGSVLTEDRGAKIWPRFLPFPGFYEKKLSMEQEVNIVPIELVKQVYGNLKSELEGFEENFEVFPYDWRKNNIKQLELLEEYIDLSADEVILVAHSMGGLIAKLFINKYKGTELGNKVKKLITLGTPWLGAADAYKTIKYGKSLFWGLVLRDEDAKSISPTFPSIYQLLPNEQYFKEIREREGIPLLSIPEKTYDNWDEFFTDKVEEYFKKCKYKYNEVFDEFRELLEQELEIEHHEIIGFGVETIIGLSESDTQEVDAHFRNGDGTVPLFSAMSNATKQYYLKGVGHDKLPQNQVAINIVKSILDDQVEEIEGNEILYSNVEEVLELGFDAYIVRIACPVMVSLIDSDGNVIYGYSDSIEGDNKTIINSEEYNVFTVGTTIYVVVKNLKENDVNIHTNETHENNNGKIIVEAYDQGPTSISIEKYKNGRLDEIETFKTFEIEPSKTAELLIEKNDGDNNQLVVKKSGEVESIVEPDTVKILAEAEEFIPPMTVVELHHEGLLEVDELLVVDDDIRLHINDAKEGSYKIDGIYCTINGEVVLIDSISKSVNIFLKEGMNEIKVFARDILGNTEEPQVFHIYKIKDSGFDIHVGFYPYFYEIKVQENESLSRLMGEVPIEAVYPHIELDDDEGSVGNNIFYKGKNRKITIKYKTILGKEISKVFYVFENEVVSIFEGVSKVEVFNEFLRGLGLTNPNVIKLTKKEGRGAYSTIKSNNIMNSKHFYISKDGFCAELFRNQKYKISFQNLMEDINLKEKMDYKFYFKVISLSNGEEVRELPLKYYIRFDIGNEEFLSDEYNIDYDYEQKAFVGEVDLRIIKNIADKYWDDSKLNEIEIVINERNSGNILRAQRITVR